MKPNHIKSLIRQFPVKFDAGGIFTARIKHIAIASASAAATTLPANSTFALTGHTRRPARQYRPLLHQLEPRLTVALMLFPPFLMAWPTRNPPARVYRRRRDMYCGGRTYPPLCPMGYPLGMRSTPSQTVSAQGTNGKIERLPPSEPVLLFERLYLHQ